VAQRGGKVIRKWAVEKNKIKERKKSTEMKPRDRET
jgi:hypothetical protein